MIELWDITYTEQSIICTEKDWHIGRGIDAASHTKSTGVVVLTAVPEKVQGGETLRKCYFIKASVSWNP